MVANSIHQESLRGDRIRLLYIDKGNSDTITVRLRTVRLERKPGFFAWLFDLWNYFEALSYTWGERKKSHQISVIVETLSATPGNARGWFDFGRDPGVTVTSSEARDFPIQSNLYEALKVLRELRPGVPLWIDAICINQEDEEEKQAQIRIMGRIYSAARTVWAFLGSPPDDMAELMKWMPKLARTCKKISDAPESSLESIRPTNWHKLASIYHQTPGLPLEGSKVWETLMSLLKRDYFDRLWILQEVALARRVVYLAGSYQIPGSTMELLTINAHRIREFHKIFETGYVINSSVSHIKTLMFPPIFGMQGLLARFARRFVIFCQRWTRENREHLEMLNNSGLLAMVDESLRIYHSDVLGELVHYTRSQKCSEAKDRILGITGLLDALALEHFVPWSSGMSADQMYIEAFYSLASEDLSFRMLRMAGVDRASGLNLPTWCPNFNKEKDRFKVTEGFSDLAYRPWYASKLKQRINRGPDSRQLILQGIQLNQVKVLSKAWQTLNLTDSMQDSDTLQARVAADWLWLQNCVEMIFKHRPVQDEVDTMNALNQLWTTLILGQVQLIGMNELAFEDFLRLLDFWERATTPESSYAEQRAHAQTMQQEAAGPLQQPTEMLVLGLIDQNMSGKEVFVTTNGTLGVAYSGIHVGDTLCVFQGASVPHVVRQVNQTNTWNLVGEAFVPAIMKGEAEEVFNGNYPESRTFVLV